MGENRSLAISHSITAALAVALTLALSMTAYIYGLMNIQASQNIVKREVEEKAIIETLNLLYWDDNGNVWVSNDGKVKVEIIKIYVDDQEVWKSRGSQPVTIDPNQVAKISLGVKGKVLAVETSDGNLIVLKR
ncbi:MAG: hypothetical protein QXP74_07730 [Nitrososphaerota archaeon]